MFTWAELRDTNLGALYVPGKGTHFNVWAPNAKAAEVRIDGRRTQLIRDDTGYFRGRDYDAKPGNHYTYSLDQQEPLPDPASRHQPVGVHGPSEIVAREFDWTDSRWKGLDRNELTIYELHVGTFSEEGTFDGVAKQLPRLQDLGINAIELMPVAQFPGKRNWGYDGVLPFATQNSYGGPAGLKRLVDACHRAGLAVILDVVYNHIGPEGNVLPKFGPYFQDRYHTPWGAALNFDGGGSDEVKKYFCANLVQWLDEFHMDGLRLDAVHSICDLSQHTLLELLAECKNELEKNTGRKLHLIAESDLNDPKTLEVGMDLQWNDDFHHSIHSVLTGERNGYYADFGEIAQLAQAYKFGTVYRDQFSPYRNHSRGKSFGDIPRNRLVVYSQNHDQIGNRVLGERLSSIVGSGKQRLAAACVFLSPFTPMIFMGEELGATNPFLYFIDHEDPALVEAVREGRKREFGFLADDEPPDPASIATFRRCMIDEGDGESNETAYYRELIKLSKWIRREGVFDNPNLAVDFFADKKAIRLVGQDKQGSKVACFFSFSGDFSHLPLPALERHETGDGFEIVFRSNPEATRKTERAGYGEVVLAPFSALLLVSRVGGKLS